MNRQMISGTLIEDVSDDESVQRINDSTQEVLLINESASKGMNHELLKSDEKRKGEDFRRLKEECLNENVEFKNEKELVEFIFALIAGDGQDTASESFENMQQKKFENNQPTESKNNEIVPKTSEKNQKSPETSQEIEILKSENTPHLKHVDSLLDVKSSGKKPVKLEIQEAHEIRKFHKIEESLKKISDASTLTNPTNILSEIFGRKNARHEGQSIIDASLKTNTSKTGTKPNIKDIPIELRKTLTLEKLLLLQKDAFPNSILKQMILNSDEKLSDLNSTKENLITQLASKYDQYLMNDNLEFISEILTLVFERKKFEKNAQDPLTNEIIKLLIKRLLNTTDNYVQCEKSYSLILSKFTKNVRERFNDLKSYLLNQKLKNMADLKVKTNALVKKMNLTLDSIGTNNGLVTNAIARRQEHIEGFVGNYVERDAYNHLDLNKIQKKDQILELPKLKGMVLLQMFMIISLYINSFAFFFIFLKLYNF